MNRRRASSSRAGSVSPRRLLNARTTPALWRVPPRAIGAEEALVLNHLNLRRVAAALVLASPCVASAYTFDASDFAVEVVGSTGLDGTGLYNDPAATLGRPTLRFDQSFTPGETDLQRASLVAGAFATGPSGEKLITTIGEGTSLTVRMGRAVTDDPSHPFGVDLLVFGNSFYTGVGGAFADDDTDLNGYVLGPLFGERAVVSVSPDGTNWYTYADGPFADSALPTNSFLYDSANAAWTETEADPTLPVDPSLASGVVGRTAADVLDDVYRGSAGGTGFDLAESGFASISFVRVEGLSGFSGGEVDAFAAVRAVPEPAAMGLVVAAGALLRRNRRRS